MSSYLFGKSKRPTSHSTTAANHSLKVYLPVILKLKTHGFSQLLFLQNYPCTNIFHWWSFFSFFFQFALLFRKINVYVQNIIHHALKAEVIQEMIAGKIRSLPQRHSHTHTVHKHMCRNTPQIQGTSSHSLPWLCQVHRGENSQGFIKEFLTDKVKSQTFPKKKVLMVTSWYIDIYHDYHTHTQQYGTDA